MSAVYEFDTSREVGDQADLRIERVLRNYFRKDFLMWEKNYDDRSLDMQGIDGWVTLSDKRVLSVDMKYCQPRGRVPFETWSKYEQGKLGWACKPQHTDLVVFIKAHEQCSYVIPFPALQVFFRHDIANRTQRAIPNKGWTTYVVDYTHAELETIFTDRAKVSE